MTIYRNAEGSFFEFVGFAKHVHTGDELAVYYGIDNGAPAGNMAMPRAEFEAIVRWPDGSDGPRFRPTIESDKVRVYYCTLRCPACDEPMPRGEFSSKEEAIAALKQRPCESCDRAFHSEIDDEEDWLNERDYMVEPPYAEGRQFTRRQPTEDEKAAD